MRILIRRIAGFFSAFDIWICGSLRSHDLPLIAGTRITSLNFHFLLYPFAHQTFQPLRNFLLMLPNFLFVFPFLLHLPDVHSK